MAGAFAIRTPPDNVVHSFAGLSLAIAPTGALYSSGLTFKTTGTNGAGIETVNLILNGGFVNAASSTNGTFDLAVLAGTMSVTSSSATEGPTHAEIYADQFRRQRHQRAHRSAAAATMASSLTTARARSSVNFTNAGTNAGYSGVISVGSLTGTAQLPPR